METIYFPIKKVRAYQKYEVFLKYCCCFDEKTQQQFKRMIKQAIKSKRPFKYEEKEYKTKIEDKYSFDNSTLTFKDIYVDQVIGELTYL